MILAAARRPEQENCGAFLQPGFSGGQRRNMRLRDHTAVTNAKHAPVPGGSRNCVRCRWFLTEPHYLPALAAHFNTIAYHFYEARNACLANENALLELKKQKADAEEAGHGFLHLDTYRQAERVWEGSMKRFNDFAEDLAACWRLIERCKSALEVTRDGDTQLVAVGKGPQGLVNFFWMDGSDWHQLAKMPVRIHGVLRGDSPLPAGRRAR